MDQKSKGGGGGGGGPSLMQNRVTAFYFQKYLRKSKKYKNYVCQDQ